MELPVNITFNLFDPSGLSILHYSCDLGFTRAENIERVFRNFYKQLINILRIRALPSNFRMPN